MSTTPTPVKITSTQELDDLLSHPQQRVVEMMRRLPGDIIILGIGGKMGVTLGLQAVRASKIAGVNRSIYGVSRFSDAAAREQLEHAGVKTIACDLLDPGSVDKLPDAPNVIFMAGRKFGTSGSTELTWAMNTIVPAIVSRKFKSSRIVAFSTGCVYPFVSPVTGGCTESTPPSPVGEYAQSCLGRERIFEHYAIANSTPVNIIRLNYAVELRYGVLHDIASAVWRSEPVSLAVGSFNMIWQGDANAIALLQLENCNSPARIVNLTGPDILYTREVAEQFGQLLDKTATFKDHDTGSAYLNNASGTLDKFGGTSVDSATLVKWNAEWVAMGGQSLSKPTHFEVNDGSY